MAEFCGFQKVDSLEAPFWELPEDLLAAIFSRVPLDQRVRCEQVSRSWRTQMRQPALWRVIDFASVPGRAERVTDEVLLEVSTDSGLDSSVLGLSVSIAREHSLVDMNFVASRVT